MRLIDADKMIPNGLENKTLIVQSRELMKTQEIQIDLLFNDVIDFINSQPTVDAKKISHGKWIEGINYKCSICGAEVVDNSYLCGITFNYCPNCGADMREEQDV